VTAGITRLGGFQLSNGGMSYWQGGTVADDWSTSYTGHFMIETEKKGTLQSISKQNGFRINKRSQTVAIYAEYR
jgi:uncharacterized protein YfaS (alpha-2-macroglobulin family)